LLEAAAARACAHQQHNIYEYYFVYYFFVQNKKGKFKPMNEFKVAKK
jgi:hypothetical protein